MDIFKLARKTGVKYYVHATRKPGEMYCTDVQLIAFAEAVARLALESAASKFDGATPYNWTAASEYANAFDIANELRYMATELSNELIVASPPLRCDNSLSANHNEGR